MSIMENNNIKISKEARDNEPELNFSYFTVSKMVNFIGIQQLSVDIV